MRGKFVEGGTVRLKGFAKSKRYEDPLVDGLVSYNLYPCLVELQPNKKVSQVPKTRSKPKRFVCDPFIPTTRHIQSHDHLLSDHAACGCVCWPANGPKICSCASATR